MNMRLQTSKRKTAKAALTDGLDKLSQMCDDIDSALDRALQQHESMEE